MSNPAFDGNFQVETLSRNREGALAWNDFATPEEMERAYGRGQEAWPLTADVRSMRYQEPGSETQYTHITFDSANRFYNDGWNGDPGIYAWAPNGWDMDPGIYMPTRRGWDIDPGIYMDIPFGGDPRMIYDPGYRNGWDYMPSGWRGGRCHDHSPWGNDSWAYRDLPWGYRDGRDPSWGYRDSWAYRDPRFYNGSYNNGSLLQFDPGLAIRQEMLMNGQMPAWNGQIFDPRQAVIEEMWRNNMGQPGFRPPWSRIPANFAY